jgi:hypothetical protein
MKTFYSHGKLLLSGEYLVLDGALSLALPTRYGQWLRVRASDADGLEWKSCGPDGDTWFASVFSKTDLQELQGNEARFTDDTRGRLCQILGAILRLRPDFMEELQGVSVETQVEFPLDWGLGSSSTLISNLAYWSGTSPFRLLSLTFGGSGYDVAAAREEGPFFYKLNEDGDPEVEQSDFDPPFANELFFVHLNQKQDSREGISRYRDRSFDRAFAAQACSDLTRQLAGAATLQAFSQAMDRHESLISGLLGMPTVKESRFPDYAGSVKSLGAWGGDFILATGAESDQEYFRKKGFSTLLSYREMIR